MCSPSVHVKAFQSLNRCYTMDATWANHNSSGIYIYILNHGSWRIPLYNKKWHSRGKILFLQMVDFPMAVFDYQRVIDHPRFAGNPMRWNQGTMLQAMRANSSHITSCSPSSPLRGTKIAVCMRNTYDKPSSFGGCPIFGDAKVHRQF